MNKYIYSVCDSDSWPVLNSVLANSITDAEDKVMMKYDVDNKDYLEFQESMNNRGIVISDLYDIEEL